MSWLSAETWGRLSRPIELLDENLAPLGTISAVLRAPIEGELQGGAIGLSAVMIVPQSELEDAGIDLRAYLRVRDPAGGGEFVIESAGYAFGPGQVQVWTCNLSGVGP